MGSQNGVAWCSHACADRPRCCLPLKAAGRESERRRRFPSWAAVYWHLLDVAMENEWKCAKMCQNVPICFHFLCLEANVLPPDDEQEAMADLPGLCICCACGFRKTLGHRCGSNWLSSQDFKNECFLQAIRNEFCGSNASPNSKSTGCVIFLARAVVRTWLWCIFWSFFYWVIIRYYCYS